MMTINLSLLLLFLQVHHIVGVAQPSSEGPIALTTPNELQSLEHSLEHSLASKNSSVTSRKQSSDSLRIKKRGEWSDWWCEHHFDEYGIKKKWEEARSTCTGEHENREARISCIKWLDEETPGDVGDIRECHADCGIDYKCTVFVQLKDSFGRGDHIIPDPRHLHSGTSVYCDSQRPRWVVIANPPSADTCYEAPEIHLGENAGGAEKGDESVVLLATDAYDVPVAGPRRRAVVPELHFEISESGKPGTFKNYAATYEQSSARLALATAALSFFVRFCIRLKPWQIRQYPRLQLTANAALVHKFSRLELDGMTFNISPGAANELKRVTTDFPSADQPLLD